MQNQNGNHPSSYRDPSGHLFYKDNILYRQINKSYQSNYDQFIKSGLYNKLKERQLIIPHEEVQENLTGSSGWHLTIRPELIPFISYPYEWCFEMLKDAALLTIEVAKEALNFNMILKDASAYNIQFLKGKPILIDSLSFEHNDGSRPWVAYRQFCEHFLAPLAIMNYLKFPIQNVESAYLDGIPLSLARKILPFKSKLNLNTYLHIHLHATISSKTKSESNRKASFTKSKLIRLLNSLNEAIRSYSFNSTSGIWSDYYKEASQRENYISNKKRIINKWLDSLDLRTAIDIGANEGEYSYLLSERGIHTISVDQDHYSINNLYKKIREEKIESILPLIMNIVYPSPSIGLLNSERPSFFERIGTDLVLALALIHHLAIVYNIGFEILSKLFRKLGKILLIEFIPESDPKIVQMLKQKGIENNWYNKDNFLEAFSREYEIKASEKIDGSDRTLFLMIAYEK